MWVKFFFFFCKLYVKKKNKWSRLFTRFKPLKTQLTRVRKEIENDVYIYRYLFYTITNVLKFKVYLL